MKNTEKARDNHEVEWPQPYLQIVERENVLKDENTVLNVERKMREYSGSIWASVHEPMLVLDADFKVVSANSSFYLTFGLKPEVVQGRLIYDLNQQQWNITKLRELLKEIGLGSTPVSGFEIDHAFPVLGRKVIEINAIWLPTEPEKTKLILLSIQDVTEKKCAEERLGVSELRYRRLFETTQDGILILDALEGKITDVNPFLIEMLGYSREEFIGKRLWEIGPFKDIEASQESLKELQTKGYVRYENLPLETKNGYQISVEFVSNIYEINGDRVIQCNVRDITKRKHAEDVLAIARDELEARVQERTSQLSKTNEELVMEMAERKLAEEELRQSEVHYRELADSIADVFFALDNELKYTYWNKASEKLTGVVAKEALGKHFFSVFPENDVTRKLQNMYQEVIKTNESQVYVTEYPGVQKLIHEISVYPSNGGVTVFVKDITDRKQAEDALKTSVEALMASEKRYSTIFESAAEGILIIDFEKEHFKYSNPAINRMLGYSQEEFKNMNSNDIYSKDPIKNAVTEIGKGVFGEETLESGIPCLRKDGGILYVDINTTQVLLDGIKCSVSFFTNVTERKLAEEGKKRNIEKLLKVMGDTIKAMAMTVEIKDPYTSSHQQRVSKLATCIAQEMGLTNEQIKGISIAGTIHDIGKMYVPSEILSKPGKLNAVEFALVKMHSQAGYDILKIIEFPWPVAQTVLQHHERMDGSGYPDHLSGKAIILEARIIAVADVVEAIASRRPYRAALGIDKALEEISQQKGALYDSDVVDACLTLFNEKGFKFDNEIQ
jgi:PAS domain S-box-containing protein